MASSRNVPGTPKRQSKGRSGRHESDFGTPRRDLEAALSRKSLFTTTAQQSLERRIPSAVVSAPCWSEKEYLALVKFLLLHSNGKKWIAIKDMKFWTKAGEFIKDHLKTTYQRSGNHIAL